MPYDDYEFGPILLALTVGLLARSAYFSYLPYTVWLVLGGMVVGVIFTESPSVLNSGLQNSTYDWINLNPKILMTVFIPILVFASAWSAHGHLLRRQIWQVLWLAFPAVLFNSLLTGVLIKYILLYDFEWFYCFLLGSILSLTDPVAIVSLLKELGVSEVLSTLIETVSIFNDGSALVLFHIFLSALEDHELAETKIPILFIRFTVGGAALGFGLGLLASQVLRVIVNDALAEITLTLVMCYSTWILAEDTIIQVSGVIAVVVMGLTLSRHGRPFVSPSVQQSLADFWYLLDFIANTVVFFIAGLIIIGQTVERRITANDWQELFLLYILLYVVRFLSVVLSWPILKKTGYGINMKQGALIVHSGLRGSMALILALIVDGTEELDENARDKVVFFVGGIVVMTLILQGSTTKMLVQKLGLNLSTEAQLLAFKRECLSLEQALQDDVTRFKEDDFLAEADWTAVWRYLPTFTPETYWLRIIGGHIFLTEGEVTDVIVAAKKSMKHEGSIDMHDIELGEDPDLERDTQTNDVTWFSNKSWFLQACNLWVNRYRKYHDLPSNLRKTWRNHAKVYGGSAFSISHLEFEGMSLGAFLKTRMIDTVYEVTGDQTADLGGNNQNIDHDWEMGSARSNIGILAHDSFRSQARSQQRLLLRNYGGRSSPNQRFFNSTQPKSDSRSFWLENAGLAESESANMERLIQWRLRYLEALRANYSILFYEGRLTGSGLKVLNDSVNDAHHRVEHGQPIDSWSFIAERYHQPSCFSRIKGTFRSDTHSKRVLKGPVMWLETHLFHKRLTFIMHLSWNFVVAHKLALNTRQLPSPDPEHAQKILEEHVTQVELASQELFQLLKENPDQARSVKTQIASRTMLFAVQEHINRQYHDGRITQMESLQMSQGVTAGLKALSFHPIIENKPHMLHVLARIEFLHLLTTSQLKYIVDSGLVKSKEYIGSVELLKQGEIGGRTGHGCYYIVRGSVVRCEDSILEYSKIYSNLNRDFQGETIFEQDPESKLSKVIERKIKVTNQAKVCDYENHPGRIAHFYGRGDQKAGKLLSMGVLIGVTDALLNVPNHVTYITGAYSSLLFFDIPKLLELSESMKELKLGIWSTLAAHLLGRCLSVQQINHMHSYSSLSLSHIHQILACAEFVNGDMQPRVSLDEHASPSPETDSIVITLFPKSQGIILKGTAKGHQNANENTPVSFQVRWTSLGRARVGPSDVNPSQFLLPSQPKQQQTNQGSKRHQVFENGLITYQSPVIVENKTNLPFKICLSCDTKAFIIK